ncbi:MAG: tetratricopeptide repeat protein [Calditrichaeota bacterium]|nr:tetratricopeptide repeat protein [Calditrichota bacterium]
MSRGRKKGVRSPVPQQPNVSSSPDPPATAADFTELCATASRLLAEGEYEAALPFLQKAVAIDPAYAPGYCQLGQVYYSRMMWREAEAHFKKALALDFGLLEAHYDLALLYQRQHRFREALPFFKQVVLANPGDWESFLRMGQCTAELGNLVDAEAFYAEALRLKPDSIEAAGGLAQVHLRKGCPDKAVEVLELAVESHPDCIELRAALAFSYEQQGEYEKALAHFYHLVNEQPEDAQFFLHLAICCVELGLLQEAEPFLAKAAQLEPESLDAIEGLGRLYVRTGKVEQAINALEHWLRIADRSAQWGIEAPKAQRAKVVRLLAECYAHRGEPERAEALLSLARQAETQRQEAVKQAYADEGGSNGRSRRSA